MPSWTIRSERVVLPGGMRPATVCVENGRITAIDPPVAPAADLIDAGTMVVMPGLVDTHVHINEPGRTEWEGFETATRAAAAGGITTLIDMPLNSIPATTTVEALATKRRAATGRCHVDVGFWGGIVPGNERQLEPLARSGVFGFKCFLSPSGVEEFPNVSERDLRLAVPTAGSTGLPVLAHAEWPPLLLDPRPGDDPRRYATWLRTRPPAAEHAAIDLLMDLAGHGHPTTESPRRGDPGAGARLHIVHLASADALPAIRRARAMGLRITVETCPHYLAFSAETIADGDTALKCAPPIRERDHQDRLWRGLQDGDIDLIATDHSPAPAALKHVDDGNFLEAWGGIASLQVSLPVVWTEAARRGIPFERLAGWMSAAPARLAGLDRRKGAIAVGHDADLVIVDPDREMTVDASRLYHRHPVTPYDGARLKGLITMTMVRGAIVFQHGECVGPPTGQLLVRA